MPTHKDLLNAEVAFILYDGQVFMTNPTDSDVSLTRLVGQMDDLGYIDTPLVQSIQEFLRGENVAPQGLELVGRYHMSNGRIAPYGPVNSAENQELVRQSIQQALYNSPESPQEPSLAPPVADPANALRASSGAWHFAREFFPHVDKLDHDNCPLCGQKRSLYHLKDGYKAQAMGVHGVGLCRDCLTTRMDQHEYLTGQRISRIMAEGADIAELADRARQRIRDEIKTLTDSGKITREQAAVAGEFFGQSAYRRKLPDESFKLFDWVWNQIKRLDLDKNNIVEAHEMIVYELTPLLALLKEKNKPWPDLKSKAFDLDTAEQWVNKPDNQKLLEQAGHGGDKMGPYENEDDPIVYTFPDGWSIRSVAPHNTSTEGEEMGNCIGDNDEYHWADKIGDGYIYILSLRDPKNRPHASWAVDKADFDNGNLMTIMGPYGKENKPPIAKYQAYLDEFIQSKIDQGSEVGQGYNTYDDPYEEEPEPYHDTDADETAFSDTMYIQDVSDLEEFWSRFSTQPHDSFGVGPYPHDNNEPHYDSDYDGNPIYWYEYDAGTQVDDDPSDWENTIDDIYGSYISDDLSKEQMERATDRTQEMEDYGEKVREWACALTAAAYLAADQAGAGGASRVVLNLAQYALDKHNELAQDSDVGQEALAVSSLFVKCLETLASKNFAQLDWPGENPSGGRQQGNDLANYFTSYTDEVPLEPNAVHPRGLDTGVIKGYEQAVPAENRPTTTWSAPYPREDVLKFLDAQGPTSPANLTPSGHLAVIERLTTNFNLTREEAEDVLKEYEWNIANPGGYLEKADPWNPERLVGKQVTIHANGDPNMASSTKIVSVEDNFVHFENAHGLRSGVDKNRFVQWWQKGWVIPADSKQNPDQMQMNLPGDTIEVGDTPANPLWEQQFGQGEIIDPRTDEQAMQQVHEQAQPLTVADMQMGDTFQLPDAGHGVTFTVTRPGWAESTDGTARINLEHGPTSIQRAVRVQPPAPPGAVVNRGGPRYYVQGYGNGYSVIDNELNRAVWSGVSYERAIDMSNYLNEAREHGGVGNVLRGANWHLIES